MTTFLYVLSLIGGFVLLWFLCGWIAFRLNVAVLGGVTVDNETYYSSVLKRDVYGKRPLTPKDGCVYTFGFGIGGLVIVLIRVLAYSIKSLHSKAFPNGVDRSMLANRFFGIK